MADDIRDALAAPFEPSEVKFKPQSVKGNRAKAIAYIDARLVEDRLDEVVGVGGWQDEYQVLPDGSVVCQLRVKINGEWVTKTDVGSQSEQPDEGDRMKAAFSDALKRAAVKYGVGRYLYRLPSLWVDYDPQKRQFTAPVPLPKWALPKQAAVPAAPVGSTTQTPPPKAVPHSPTTLFWPGWEGHLGDDEPHDDAVTSLADSLNDFRQMAKLNGFGYERIVQAINEEFGTDYTPHTPFNGDHRATLVKKNGTAVPEALDVIHARYAARQLLIIDDRRRATAA
jgi:hypothetical protein